MTSHRKIAVIAGILFIVATVTGVVSVLSFGAVLDTPVDLAVLSAAEGRVVTGTVFYFIMAVTLPAIAVALYPVLKKYNEALALGYLGARIAEGGFFILDIISILTVLTLSRGGMKGGVSDSAYVQDFTSLLRALGDWAYLLAFGVFFALSALILNSILYRTKLVPAWLPVWGLVGAALIFLYYFLHFLDNRQFDVLLLPIAVQEMALALWLIVKGFDPAAFESRAA